MIALTIDEVSVRYPRLPRLALDHISFDLHSGEVLALLGPNGAGKTSLVKVICGLVSPVRGRVCIAGEDVERSPLRARRHLGVLLYAERSFYFRLTGLQNLLFFAGMDNIFGSQALDVARELLQRFNLWDARNLPFMKYSLGMRKKLALARSLLKNPPVLLLDEPTANLDPVAAAEVLELLDDLRKDGRAVILTTHQLHEAERIADRVAFIKEGKLAALDHVEYVQSALPSTLIYLETNNSPSSVQLARLQNIPGIQNIEHSGCKLVLRFGSDVDLSTALRLIGKSGLSLCSIHSQAAKSLEEVFFEVVR